MSAVPCRAPTVAPIPSHNDPAGRQDPRDGGEFAAVAACPKCGTVAVHGLRAVNPAPPTPIDEYARTALEDFAALLVIRKSAESDWFGKNDGYTRWDERPFEVVRVCVGDGCGFEWGQR